MFKKFLKEPKYYAILLLGRILPDTVAADAFYLKLLYKNRMKKKLNLDNPQTFNEKLQWLKLYDRKPEYTMMADKCEVKKYVADILGEEYIIPTLGVWNSFDEIEFDSLPNQFVLKCTHDSGGLVICKDKTKFDKAKARKKINHALKRKYFLNTREWPYKDVKPRIIAEKYVEDSQMKELRDYKFFVFNGVTRALFIASARQMVGEETKFDFFDTKFNRLPFTNGHPNADLQHEKPEAFEKMISLAEKLSQKIPHVRVDLYNVNGKILFGEMTFYHWSGLMPFQPEEWDFTFGKWIKLPERTERNANT